MVFKRYPTGSLVQVLWSDKAYMARVLKVEGDFHWITYPGYDSSYDEWVLSDRILESNTAGVLSPNSMPSVMVEWKGRSFPAVVLDRKGDEYRVHYLGWDNSWDEWVPASRVHHPSGIRLPDFAK